MRKRLKTQLRPSDVLILMVMSILFLNLNVMAAEKVTVDKTFKAVENVQLKVVSGDCVVKEGKGNQIQVHMWYTYSKDHYKPVFEENGNTLILKDDFAEDIKGSLKGKCYWEVSVPAKTRISVKAASGDVTVSGVEGGVNIKAASGDIKLKDVSGELNIKAASGDIKIEEAAGTFAVKCASGDIECTGISITADSALKSVSGDLELVLAKSAAFNLDLATVSGDIILDYNKNAVKGHFTFKGQKGNIKSDVPFDNKDEDHGYSPFIKKYFKKGDSPVVNLKTVSGNLELRK